MPEPLILADMSWPEFKAALPQLELAIIPVGSCEQHGPNMALRTDITLATEVAKRLAARLYPKAIVTPSLPWGISFHHMGFPGTISLRHDTFTAVIMDVVRSLKAHGLSKFFILSGHGGNSYLLGVIVWRIKTELGVHVASARSYPSNQDMARFAKTPRHGHACEIEVSEALYLAPDLVKRDALAKGEVKTLPYRHTGAAGPDIAMPISFLDVTANGALGDATLATPEMGEAIVNLVVNQLTEFLEDFIQHGNIS